MSGASHEADFLSVLDKSLRHDKGVLIVTPYGPETGSGNWRTAERYARLLSSQGLAPTIVVGAPTDAQLGASQSALVLHARRSHAAAVLLRSARIPYGVVLTGTDLYADLAGTSTPEFFEQAVQTIRHAKVLIGLQNDACVRVKNVFAEQAFQDARTCRVLLQSAGLDLARVDRGVRPDRARNLRVLVVGHVRKEKDPLTAFEAFLTLPTSARLRHLGGSLDVALMQTLQGLAARNPQRIALLGHSDADTVRAEMAKADLLVHPSVMEGGALVIAEAFGQGLPVLASRIPGHLGILGADYPAYFAQGDVNDLSRQMHAFLSDNAVAAAWFEALRLRAPALCSEEREAQQLLGIVQEIVT
jgi:glycosyltransferase involved in cell wall biosynthesis